MSKDSLQHLSSLMDGELSAETSLFVARRAGSDQQLGNTWARYHLVRECLRHPGGKWAVTGLSLDLDELGFSPAGEVHSEPVPASASPHWLKAASGFAIAASVALVAVLVAVPGAEDPAGNPGLQAQPFTSPNPLTAVKYSQPASFNGGQGTANQRLNTYLLRHNQVAGSVGKQGFISFVPIVTAAPVQVIDPEATAQEAGEADAETDTQPQN